MDQPTSATRNRTAKEKYLIECLQPGLIVPRASGAAVNSSLSTLILSDCYAVIAAFKNLEHVMKKTVLLSMVVFATLLGAGFATDLGDEKFQLIDIFQLEYAADPQISPDGQRIVYVR